MGLVEHADRELKLAGVHKPEADYGGMLYDAVMELVEAHAKQGHSGYSHQITLHLFNKVINFENLTPIGSTPDEWMLLGEDSRGTCYQNKRKSTLFSYDAGKTWYDIDDPEKKNWPKDIVSPQPMEQ